MKTKLKTPYSHFSKSENRLEIVQPTSLSELTQQQLLYILKCRAAGIPPMELQTYCFFRFAGLQDVAHDDDNVHCIYKDGWHKRHIVLSPSAINEFASMLAFINEPTEPVRLDKIQGCKAADAYMHGVSFEQYLMIEGFWFAFLRTQREDLLLRIAKVLYHGRSWIFYPKTPKRLTTAEQLNIIYWMTGWKVFCGEHWQNFFRRVSEDVDDDDDSDDIESAISMQIRALTGGDITKVAGVMHADVWDALTELDALAKESQDRKTKTPKQ